MGNDSSPGSKRSRAEDEVYLDNFHSHKRYLSEVMASSLNGLKVGDASSGKQTPQVFDLIDSSALTETACFSKSLSSYPSNGDEISTLDSYMSDDSDDSICYRSVRYNHELPPQHTLSYLCESSRTRQRVPDAEIRFPPSPSDPCHAADLRRAALLRSLQMRAQSPVAVSDAPVVDECLDTSVHNLTEVVDQCSPSSPNFDDPSAEQTASNHDILGSPIHGTFPGQVGRVSSRARSLLLDECASLMAATYNDVVPDSFGDTLSSAIGIHSSSIEEQQKDITHKQGLNFETNLESVYTEEVSDSIDNVDISDKREWSPSR